MKQILFLVGMIAFICCGCNNDDQKQIDKDLILAYIDENNLDAITDEDDDGLYYVITEAGLSEDHPVEASTVQVRYKGYFMDGEIFDENQTFDGASFALTSVIQGWTIGIPKLTPGGKGILIIPSHLAYGTRGSGSIPSNTPIVFDVELLDFQ